MTFEPGRRRGKVWDDANELHNFIMRYNFQTTGKKERDFENGFASALDVKQDTLNSKLITQTHKSSSVRSVFCFGKRHRPDMTLDEAGIAIEIKFVKYSGLRDAIGQGLIYRNRYRFVFLILIFSDSMKATYSDIQTKKEKDMGDMLHYLADNLNIFTYIAPSFKQKIGEKACIAFFEPNKEV